MLKRERSCLWSLMALAGFLLLTACAHAPRQDGCSLPGRGQWREYVSKHFLIDAEEGADPGKLVAAFEDLRVAVARALVNSPIEGPTRVRVVALPTREDVRRVVGSSGAYSMNTLDREPIIFISAEDVDSVPQIIAHELAHMVSYYVLPRQKLWFTEGLAQFVQSVATVDAAGRRWAGRQPVNTVSEQPIPLMPTEALFNPDPKQSQSQAFYLTSWLLYRYLWNERDTQFTDYWRRLQNGESPDDAWHAVFPEWDLSTGKTSRLNLELEHYRQTHAKGLRWEVKISGVDHSFTTTAASRAQLHMLLLYRELNQTDPAVQKQLRRPVVEEALREEPDYPFALAELAKLDGKPVLPAMRAATTSHPKDGLGWYLLGHAAKDPTEREAALRAAIALWPEFAMARAELASLLASTGRAQQALPIATLAVKLAPWNPLAVASLAEVAMELGECKRAVALQTRVVEIAEALEFEELDSFDKGLFRRRLTDYRTRCKGAHVGTSEGN